MSVRKSDNYGFRLKDVTVCKRKNFISIGALYTNYHTAEEANFTIKFDRSHSYIYDAVKTAEVKNNLENKDIVEGFKYLLEIKSEKESLKNLVSQIPESIMFNHKEAVRSILEAYADDEQKTLTLKKAFQARYKFLTDNMIGKVK